jgi:hypothetical protein
MQCGQSFSTHRLVGRELISEPSSLGIPPADNIEILIVERDTKVTIGAVLEEWKVRTWGRQMNVNPRTEE